VLGPGRAFAVSPREERFAIGGLLEGKRRGEKYRRFDGSFAQKRVKTAT
jgi:hypothetical protein